MNSNIPTISIVIPVYNVGRYVEATLESVINQSCHDYEIIIVNDGSTDNTFSICSDFIRRRKLINCKLLNIENSGVINARKKGVQHSIGEWVCFVDGDDLLPCNAIANYIENMREDSDVIIGNYSKLLNNDTLFVGSNIGDKTCNPFDYVKDYVFNYVPGSPWARIFRRKYLSEDVFDLSRNITNKEDVIMNMRVMSKVVGKILYIRDNVYTYRWLRPDSAYTRYNNRYTIQYELNIISYIELSLLKFRDNPDYKRVISFYYLKIFLKYPIESITAFSSRKKIWAMFCDIILYCKIIDTWKFLKNRYSIKEKKCNKSNTNEEVKTVPSSIFPKINND